MKVGIRPSSWAREYDGDDREVGKCTDAQGQIDWNSSI